MKKDYLTLFTMDKGRLRYWKAYVLDGRDDLNRNVAQVTLTYGLIKGKATKKVSIVSEGKNIGKSNETSPFQQACLDIESEITALKNKGYRDLDDLKITKFEAGIDLKQTYGFHNGFGYRHEPSGYVMNGVNIFDNLYKYLPKIKVDINNRMKPMILHHGRLPEYIKRADKTMHNKSKVIHFPAFVQPKKDGICCLADIEHGLTTRQGKSSLVRGGQDWSDICNQVTREIRTLNWKYPLHGEMYLHGYRLDEIDQACKKSYSLSKRLELHVFDIVTLGSPQFKRIEELEKLKDYIKALDLNYIKVVPTTLVNNIEELLREEEKWLELGEEGIVVRQAHGMYEPGVRSKHVLKIVRFDSTEVEVVDVIPMDNEPTHGLFVCKVPDPANSENTTFKVMPSNFDFNRRIMFLADKDYYIGKMLTIEHRGYTQYNVPRIATAKGFPHEEV